MPQPGHGEGSRPVGWIIAGIVGIILVGGFFSFVVIPALPFWVPGMVAVVVYWLLAYIRLRTTIRNHSKWQNLTYDSDTVTVDIMASGVDKFVGSLKVRLIWLYLIFSLTGIAVAILDYSPRYYDVVYRLPVTIFADVDWDHWSVSVPWRIAAFVLFSLVVWASYTRVDPAGGLVRHLRSHAEKFSVGIEHSVGTLKHLIQELDDLYKGLGCESSVRSYEEYISDYVTQNRNRLLKDSSDIELWVGEQKHLLKMELRQLRSAQGKCMEFEENYNVAVATIPDSPSLVMLLDRQYLRYQTAIEEYLCGKNWDLFFETMDYLIEELQRPMTAEPSLESRMTVQLAHLILETEPTWTWDQITKAYRNKVRKFHPDGSTDGMASDQTYIKLINSARDTLNARRSGGT